MQQESVYGGLGLAVQTQAVAPVVDLAGGLVFVLIHSGVVKEDCAKDTVGGGLFLQARGPDANGQDIEVPGNYGQPSVEAAGLNICFNRYRTGFRPSLGFPFPITPAEGSPGSPFVLPYWGDTWAADTSAPGDVDIELPKSGFPRFIEAQAIEIIDVGGNAAVNRIRVHAPAGETFVDGSAFQDIIANYGKLRVIAFNGTWIIA
jgi:hypothetical protein